MKYLRLLAIGLFVAVACQGLAMAAEPDPMQYYRLGQGDVIELVVWREQALTRNEVLVRPDGRISLPLADDIKAAGLTSLELKEEITRSLRRFIEEPKVYVIIRDPKSYHFLVIGNVMKPGKIPLSGPTSVLQALSICEGFNEWANKTDVVVVRRKGEEYERFPFNYKEVVAGHKDKDREREIMAQNIQLRPGDVIVVP